MKKLSMLLLSLLLVLTACANYEKKDETKAEVSASETTKENLETKEETKINKEEEIGQGKFILSNASGTTENGEVLKVLSDEDTLLLQIEAETDEIDGKHFSYIYIDGINIDKLQISESQFSLDLMESFLDEGKHLVTLKQYDNDKEDGKVITIKNAEYEIVR